MTPLVRTCCAALLALPLAGCASLFQGMLGDKPSGSGTCSIPHETSDWKRESSDVYVKKWDLGSGSLEDIKRLAPGFYAFPVAMPSDNTFFGREDALRRQQGAQANNDFRQELLVGMGTQRNPDNLRLEPGRLDGLTLLSVRPPTANREPSVRLWRSSGESLSGRLLVTWKGCARIEATDKCEKGHLSTSVRIAGTGSCIPEGRMLAEITLNHRREQYRPSLRPKPREVVAVEGGVQAFAPEANEEATGEVPVRLLSPDGQHEYWKGIIKAGSFTEATRDEVLALFKSGDETAGAEAFRALSIPADAAFDGEVAKARLEGVRQLLGRCAGKPDRLGVSAPLKPKGQPIPGDDEVGKALVPAMLAAADSIQGAGSQAFMSLTFLLTKAGSWDTTNLTTYRTRFDALEDRFGPAVADGKISEKVALDMFRTLFPSSKHLEALGARRAAEGQAAASERAQRQHDELWENVEYPAVEIAQKRYGVRFIRQNARDPRSQAGANRMEQHVAMIIRDQYCPARKAFVAAAGIKEFQARAATKCREDAPVGTGLGGTQITLTSDCQAAFSTGCP